jgi:hypothetical protein
VEFVTTGENGISEILIRDLTGSEVMRFDFNVPVYKKSVDISNILNGTYIVEVVVGNHRVARRLVVLR